MVLKELFIKDKLRKQNNNKFLKIIIDELSMFNDRITMFEYVVFSPNEKKFN